MNPALRIRLATLCWAMAVTAALPAQAPDLIHYRFNEGSGTTTANLASPGVGSASGTVSGLVLQPAVGCGMSGALRGQGTAGNYVDTGWNPNLISVEDWSIGCFVDSSQSTATANTLWSVASSGDSRNFNAYGQKDPFTQLWTYYLTRSSSTMNGVAITGVPNTGAHHLMWVKDATNGTINAYLDGVFKVSVAQPFGVSPLDVSGGLTLKVGGGPGTGQSLGNNILLEDFRLYNRIVLPAEINAIRSACGTWTGYAPPPVPSNDTCSGAIVLSLGANAGTTVGATATTSGISGICFPSGATLDVWYRWTAPSACAAVFRTSPPGSATFDTYIGVYTGTCGALTAISTSCNDNAGGSTGSQAVVQAQAGVTYFVRVAGVNGATGTFVLNLACYSAPPNDVCSLAVPLPTNGNVATSNFGAALLADAATTCGSQSGTATNSDVWFYYNYPGPCTDAILNLSLCASLDLQSVITVFSGSCSNLVPVLCDDSGCLPGGNVRHAHVAMNVQQGVPYYIAVASYGSTNQSEFSLQVATVSMKVVSFGAGCGYDPNSGPPNISATPPLLGTTGTITANGFQPFSPAYIFGSNPHPGTGLPFGDTCVWYLDPASPLVLLSGFTDSQGSIALTAPLPSDPAFECQHFWMTAISFPVPPPLPGITVQSTDVIDIRLGTL